MFEFETYWDNSEATPATAALPAFPMTIAACYVSTKEQWDEFNRNWGDVLKGEGLAFFHMTDFMARVKPYDDWDQTRRDRVYYRLASIINTRIRAGFVLGLPAESFDLYPQHLKDALGKRHFTFAVRSALDLVRHWYASYGRGKAVRYVFDRMGKGKGEIMEIFELMKERSEIAAEFGALPGKTDGIAFQNKEFSKPLQATDILAWNMRSFMQNEIRRGLPEAPSRVRPYFQILRESRSPVRIGFFRDGDIEKGANDMLDYEEREGRPAYTMSRKQLREWRKSEATK